MASNLKRSKRTVGKRIVDLERRVTRVQKMSVPTAISQGAVGDFQLSDFSADKITAGTIDASVVTVTNLNATNITAGTLALTTTNGIALTAGTASGSPSTFPFSVSSAGVINARSGTIGGFTLSSTYLRADYSLVTVGATESGYIQIENDGTIESNYNISSVSVNYYTTVKINDYGVDGQGSITVEGTASLAYSKAYYLSTGQYVPSDIRLKDVLDEKVDALSVVNAIEPKLFSFKRDESKKIHYGFIAQQVGKYVPDAVFEGGEDADSHPWVISADKLIPYLVGAVQQLSAKIDAFEKTDR